MVFSRLHIINVITIYKYTYIIFLILLHIIAVYIIDINNLNFLVQISNQISTFKIVLEFQTFQIVFD